MKAYRIGVTQITSAKPAVLQDFVMRHHSEGMPHPHIVEFSVQLMPTSGAKLQTVRYTAEFVNADGERILLTKERRVARALLRKPKFAARLLSQILQDFMEEINAK